MRALTWQGKRDVRVEEVPDPVIAGADRRDRADHLDRDLRLGPAPVRGARPLPRPRRRPRPRADGHRRGGRRGGHPHQARRPRGRPVQHLLRPLLDVRARSCSRSARPRRCATRARAPRCSATPSSTARCPAARPSTCASRRRTSGRSRCPTDHPDERFLFLSDILPTAWQAVQYADVPKGGTLAVLGLGPIGQMAARIGLHLGASRVIGVDLVARAAGAGRASTASSRSTSATHDDVAADLIEVTGGRGPDAVIDAVGMEADGSPFGKAAHDARRPAARRDRQAADGQDGDRPAGRAAHRASRPSAAAARSRSAASTAARWTRCR